MSALANLIFELSGYKSIAIFGYGVEGKSFQTFAKKYLRESKITIVDKNYSNDDNYLDGLREAELIIKSPGISLYNLGISYDDYNFTSITELFLKYFGAQTIGVTGTKGKSTLVTLVEAMLTNAGKKSLLCGNIGISPLEAIEQIDDETTVVMELSSHQLHHINYSPHIAILTNLFAEHLDYYEDVEEYFAAKYNIFKHQKEGDIFIPNLQNYEDFFSRKDIPAKSFYNVAQKELQFPQEFELQRGYIHKQSLQILEQLRELVGISETIYTKTLKEFQTLPHRLEFVAEIHGVNYINDSISTIPEATIAALEIVKNVDTLILGGNDRGVDYTLLTEYLCRSDVQNIICFSDTGKQIYEKIKALQNSKNIFYEKDLASSVTRAHSLAKQNVLFSPAASSFNAYANFMERGEDFKHAVEKLKG